MYGNYMQLLGDGKWLHITKWGPGDIRLASFQDQEGIKL
jgi:hypothetical protein